MCLHLRSFWQRSSKFHEKKPPFTKGFDCQHDPPLIQMRIPQQRSSYLQRSENNVDRLKVTPWISVRISTIA